MFTLTIPTFSLTLKYTSKSMHGLQHFSDLGHIMYGQTRKNYRYTHTDRSAINVYTYILTIYTYKLKTDPKLATSIET